MDKSKRAILIRGSAYLLHFYGTIPLYQFGWASYAATGRLFSKFVRLNCVGQPLLFR